MHKKRAKGSNRQKDDNKNGRMEEKIVEIKIKKREKKVPKIERIQYNDSMALGKARRTRDRKSPGSRNQEPGRRSAERKDSVRPKREKGDYEKCLNGNCLSERCHSY